MRQYILKRLLLMVPIIIGISFLLFTIEELTPGNPARLLLGEYAAQEDVDQLAEEMGLNDGFFVRYGRWLTNALHGDLGTSYRTKENVIYEIRDRFPATLQIAFYAMVLATIIGVPIGIISAVRQYSVIDVTSTVTALIFTSVPAFWLALMMILVFSVKLHLLPVMGSSSLKHFVIPAVAMAAAHMAQLIRMTRSSMLEVIRQDYIRTARSKGATEKRVILRHALRNALLPVVTVWGINFGLLVSGALIIETVCGISGLGTLMVTSVKSKDAPMLIATVMFTSILSGLINLIVDILYAYIDPRIKSKYVKK